MEFSYEMGVSLLKKSRKNPNLSYKMGLFWKGKPLSYNRRKMVINWDLDVYKALLTDENTLK